MFVTLGGELFTWRASHSPTNNAAPTTSSASPLEFCSWSVVDYCPKSQHTTHITNVWPRLSAPGLSCIFCRHLLAAQKSHLPSLQFTEHIFNCQILQTEHSNCLGQLSLHLGHKIFSASMLLPCFDLVAVLQVLMTCSVSYWSQLSKVVTMDTRDVSILPETCLSDGQTASYI